MWNAPLVPHRGSSSAGTALPLTAGGRSQFLTTRRRPYPASGNAQSIDLCEPCAATNSQGFSSQVPRLTREFGSELLTLLGIGRDFYCNLIRRFALADARLRFLYADRKFQEHEECPLTSSSEPAGRGAQLSGWNRRFPLAFSRKVDAG